MMKRLDKLVLSSFVGPFVLTFVVVVFIFLTQFMLKYVEDFVGKDLSILVFGKLLFYFSLNMAPVALPLAVLLSSLMTFGNLGEHYELTAIKSSGISLLRVLAPVFIAVVLLSVLAFFFSDRVVPRTNLKAYSLLYDIRRKKPSLDFKEGTFYTNLPGYSIKVSEKLPDGTGLLDVMIYDHTKDQGNTDLILADSGRMYTTLQERYLVLELFRGKSFSESATSSQKAGEVEFIRTDFARSKLMFSLSSFDMQRTREELFAGNKVMRTVAELRTDIDSIRLSRDGMANGVERNLNSYYIYHQKAKEVSAAAAATADTAAENPAPTRLTQYTTADTGFVSTADSSQLAADSRYQAWLAAHRQHLDTLSGSEVYTRALVQARGIRSFTRSFGERIETLEREENVFAIQMHKKFAQATACVVLFLIGAPIGAIIKKGGLGIPILISIIFFIIYYVLTIIGEKWAKEGVADIAAGMWVPNLILLSFGLFFLRQARNDSPLLDADFYTVLLRRLTDRIRQWLQPAR